MVRKYLHGIGLPDTQAKQHFRRIDLGCQVLVSGTMTRQFSGGFLKIRIQLVPEHAAIVRHFAAASGRLTIIILWALQPAMVRDGDFQLVGVGGPAPPHAGYFDVVFSLFLEMNAREVSDDTRGEGVLRISHLIDQLGSYCFLVDQSSRVFVLAHLEAVILGEILNRISHTKERGNVLLNCEITSTGVGTTFQNMARHDTGRQSIIVLQTPQANSNTRGARRCMCRSREIFSTSSAQP